MTHRCDLQMCHGMRKNQPAVAGTILTISQSHFQTHVIRFRSDRVRNRQTLIAHLRVRNVLSTNTTGFHMSNGNVSKHIKTNSQIGNDKNNDGTIGLTQLNQL